ncbi:MAG TPA: MlaD family protein [Thermoanaerobaculia bacterium]|nr:MlaD family protein [Thermoanaerobaculia bacterium]
MRGDERVDGRPEEEAPRARVHPVEWSPWIWILPLAAILVVGWFVMRYTVFGGGEITVHFVEARGLERYSPVRYRGAKVGTVQEIDVDEDLEEVVVRISMDARMGEALRTGTRFWIVEPGLEGGLGSLLTGTYVGIAPGEGEPSREFRGLEHPPILAAPEPGRIFILEAQELGQASVGSPVTFRGMRVGRVLGAEYDHQRGRTAVHVFVIEPYAVYVRESTRFWRAGGLSLGFEGGRVSMGDASLSSLLTPAFAFYTPEVLAGPEAAEGTRFELHESRNAAIAAADGPHLDYRVSFSGSVSGLAAGTPVEMRGVPVGRVRDVRLRYVPASASLETPVTLVLDPRRLELALPAGSTRENLREITNEALQDLVRNGLRARLATSLILPGASAVSLDLVGPRGAARLDLTTDPPTIPAAAGGDGLQGALAAIERVATTLEELPLRQIAGDLQSAARRVDALVHDPRLDSSLGRLDAALADVQSAAATTRENVDPIARSLRRAAIDVETAAATLESAAGTAGASVGPIAESLRRAAASAESAAAGAEQLLGAAPRQSYDLAALVEELTRAAEAVRALATYLSENPDALLRGRAP